MNVGVEALVNFIIDQAAVREVVTRFGSTTETQLQTQAQGPGNANYTLNFSVSGLPRGVTASFSPNPVPVGSLTTLSITAPATGSWIQNALFNIVATPSAAVSSESLTLDLVVAPALGSIPNNRSDYLRTDDTPQAIVYDAANQQIFASEFSLNRVDVVSTSTRQLVKSIPVLSPRGLALSVDGSEVLVGSDSQQATAISTSSLQVVRQWTLPRVSGGTYGLGFLFALSDGTFVFEPSTIGVLSEQLAIWNPANNTTSVITLPTIMENDACLVAGGGVNVLVADCSSSSKAVVYNIATKTFSQVIPFPGFVLNVAASPDGSEFIISDDTNGIGIYNSQLQLQTYLSPPDGYSAFTFSSDGARIYLIEGVIGVFDKSGSFINTAPALGTIPPGVEIFPSPDLERPMASDSSGIIFGSADHGIAFDDSAYVVNFVSGYCGIPGIDLTLTPNAGSLNTATATTFPLEIGFNAVPDVWFGGRFPLAASGDGSKVLMTSTDISGPQDVTLYDVVSNTWSSNGEVEENVGGNAALSLDGSVFATGSGMVDANADVIGYLAAQDVFHSPGPFPSLPLEKIPDGGSLVYVPYANYTQFNVQGPSCIDIFDVNHGVLVHRINLLEQIQSVTDAMAIDSFGQNIYLITNAGLTAVQLATVPLSVGRLTPSAGPAGTSVTIHGSGFLQTTTVSANGSAIPSTFVDANTLKVTLSNVAAGPAQIVVTNAAAGTYSLDNAFEVK